MKHATVLATCAIGLALYACGDDGNSSSYKGPPPGSAATAPANPAATTPPATGATTPPATGTTPAEGGTAAPAAPVAPSAPSADPSSLCKTVLANSWKSLQPALTMIGSEVAQPEADYLGNKFFIKKCSGLTAAQLDCLSKSEAPLAGIVDCKINEGAKSRDKLRLPSFRKSREKPAELPAEDQAKLLKSVVGTWKNEFKSYNQVKTWKINKSGEVKQTVVRSGKKEEKTLKIAFDRASQVRVETSPSSSQWYSYLPVNKRTMYVCNNLAYGAHSISDETNFVISTTNEHIAFKGEACKVLTDSGHFVDAKCAWEKKSKKERSFTVSYEVPDRKSATELTYDLIADHLVDRRQVDTSKFVKR